MAKRPNKSRVSPWTGKPGPREQAARIREQREQEFHVNSRHREKLVREHFAPTGYRTPDFVDLHEEVRGPRYSPDPSNPLGWKGHEEAAWISEKHVLALEAAGFVVVRASDWGHGRVRSIQR